MWLAFWSLCTWQSIGTWEWHVLLKKAPTRCACYIYITIQQTGNDSDRSYMPCNWSLGYNQHYALNLHLSYGTNPSKFWWDVPIFGPSTHVPRTPCWGASCPTFWMSDMWLPYSPRDTAGITSSFGKFHCVVFFLFGHFHTKQDSPWWWMVNRYVCARKMY